MPKIPTGPHRPTPTGKARGGAKGATPKSITASEVPSDLHTDMHVLVISKNVAAPERAAPQASGIKQTPPIDRRRVVHAAIAAALSDEAVIYAPDDVSLHALQTEAFAQRLPFLVLAHVPKYGPPTDLRPCSLWCSDVETEHNSQAQPDWHKSVQKYQRSTLFVTQANTPHVIDMGILGDLQDPAHPQRAVTAFLQLNEPDALQEPGRMWQLRAMASVYLASEHPGTCAALSTELAQGIPKEAQPSVYTDALIDAMGDRNIKIALQCVQRGADLTRPTDAGTTPLIEATLRAPIILLRRLLKAGLQPSHTAELQEAIELAQNHGLFDRIALLQEHLAALQAG